MNFWLRILVSVSLLFAVMASCGVMSADESMPEPMLHEAGDIEGHSPCHDMAMPKQAPQAATEPHLEHDCADGCDGGLGCADCFTVTALTDLDGEPLHLVPSRDVYAMGMDHLASFTPNPDSPPPRA